MKVKLLLFAFLTMASCLGAEGPINGKLTTPNVWQLDSQSPGAARIVSDAPAPHGDALCIEHRFQGTPGERLLLECGKLSTPATHTCASFRVHGERSGHLLVFLVVDANGESHSYEAIPIVWSGWKKLDIHLLKGFRSHWAGDGNKTVDFPLRGTGIVVWRNKEPRPREGRLCFADLRFETPEQALLSDLGDVEALWLNLRKRAPEATPSARTQLEKLCGNALKEIEQIRQSVAQPAALDSPQPQERIAALRNRHRFVEVWLRTHEQAPSLPFIAAVASPFEKFRPGDPPTPSPPLLRLEAAGNEWEAAQIAVAALDEPLQNVSLRLSPLRHESGWMLPEQALAWNPVGYVEDRTGTVESYTAELWPDPLLPAECTSVPAFTTQSFWVTAKVPADAKSGDYTGQVDLLVNGEPKAAFKIALHVFDFALPAKCHLKTVFGLNTHAVAEFFGEDDLSDEDYLTWTKFLLERRIYGDRLVGAYHWTPDPEKCMSPNPWPIIDAQLQRFDLLWCARISNKLLSQKPEQRRQSEQQFLDRFPAIVSDLDRRGLLNRAYLYTYDELRKEQYQMVKPFLKACKQTAPSVKVMLTFFADDPSEELRSCVDAWCPNFGWVAQNRDAVRALQARPGTEVWWYFTRGDFPLPNIIISSPPLAHRVMFWQTFHFGFTGLLHWETCCWTPNQRTEPRWPKSRWVVGGVVRDRYLYHGNGHLLYPGGRSKPLSSIRLEILREGAEDYEYLWVLRDHLRSGRIAPELRSEAERLLDLSDLIRDVRDYETDPQRYVERRRAMAGLLEKVSGADPKEHE